MQEHAADRLILCALRLHADRLRDARRDALQRICGGLVQLCVNTIRVLYSAHDALHVGVVRLIELNRLYHRSAESQQPFWFFLLYCIE